MALEMFVLSEFESFVFRTLARILEINNKAGRKPGQANFALWSLEWISPECRRMTILDRLHLDPKFARVDLRDVPDRPAVRVTVSLEGVPPAAGLEGVPLEGAWAPVMEEEFAYEDHDGAACSMLDGICRHSPNMPEERGKP
jgi:hypothetical protein